MDGMESVALDARAGRLALVRSDSQAGGVGVLDATDGAFMFGRGLPFPYDAALDDDGGVAVVGHHRQELSVDGLVLPATTRGNLYYLRFDAEGALLRGAAIGHPDVREEQAAVAIAPDGTMLMGGGGGGRTFEHGGASFPAGGWVAAFEEDGDVRWVVSLPIVDLHSLAMAGGFVYGLASVNGRIGGDMYPDDTVVFRLPYESPTEDDAIARVTHDVRRNEGGLAATDRGVLAGVASETFGPRTFPGFGSGVLVGHRTDRFAPSWIFGLEGPNTAREHDIAASQDLFVVVGRHSGVLDTPDGPLEDVGHQLFIAAFDH